MSSNTITAPWRATESVCSKYRYAVLGPEPPGEREQQERPALRHTPRPAQLADLALHQPPLVGGARIDLVVRIADPMVDDADQGLIAAQSLPAGLDPVDDRPLVSRQPFRTCAEERIGDSGA